MTDKLLELAFTDQERWQRALDKAYGKGINKGLIKELCDPDLRVKMYELIRDGKYKIAPPHTALIPKDKPGEFRTVYINEGADRILLSLINDILFDMCPEMIHPSCRSYQKGISCGSVVQKLSKEIVKYNTSGVVGWKSDLSKYFDSVPIIYIDRAFDAVERKFGASKLISVVREYYHQDIYFDTDGNLQSTYQSLKQGCAVASWLADVILYDLDDCLSKLNGVYYRFSDDMMFIGDDRCEAMDVLQTDLENMQMQLNPKKVEYVDRDHWVKFLGYSIKGEQISLSSTGIKKFQKAIEDACKDKKSYESARAAVYRALYKGYEDFSWATRVLRVINVPHDIEVLNGFVMDWLRAVQTGKHKLGGLGFVKDHKDGCIVRGTGRNVKANKEKIPTLENYYTIECMRKNLLTSRGAYDAIIRREM